MSQTETLLLFVLGFFACLFVVLLFGRGIFTVIGKWSGWRETRKVPAAIRELQAERDGLKAEKAMMAQKLEASITDMKMRMAEQMAEVSRNRNRLLDLQQTLKEREDTVSHLQRQYDDKSAQVLSLQSQIEENVKSINLAYAKMATRDDEHVKMQQVLKEAQATLVARDEKIRNHMDEAKALRELVPGMAMNRTDALVAQYQLAAANPAPLNMPPPLSVASTPSMQSFEEPVANNNPLLADTSVDSVNFPQDVTTFQDSDSVDRSVSNVLSLAERVRSLKSGMKKA
jgi:uncharacterized protein (DUF3084 family)